MMEPSALTATSPSERIAMVDALRGLALAGILGANILVFSGWGLMSPDAQAALAGSTQAAVTNFLYLALIDGKFYTLFSLLFGAGFMLQLMRLERRGVVGLRVFRRRLLILLCFGLIHLVLIWFGDILTLYASLGFLLPFARTWSNRRLVLAGMGCLASPLIGAPLLAALGWHPEAPFVTLGAAIAKALGGDLEDPTAWMRRPDWFGYLSFSLTGWALRIGDLLASWRIPKVLGVMLIGMATGRELANGRLLDRRRLLARVLVAGLIVGVPANLLYARGGDASQMSIWSLVGTVPLALAYAAGFALLWPRAHDALRFLVAPGRMALTNYLAQSVLCIAIFYGVGLGLAARTTPSRLYAVAAGIYALQIAWSRWYMSAHEQGPAEALWRRLTYGDGGGVTPLG